MVAFIFDTILQKAEKQGYSATSADARTWFRAQAATVAGANPAKIIATVDKSRLVVKPTLGNMYMFRYEAKHKDTLPYYDTFPLIFPFKHAQVSGLAGKGPAFYGLNMHYLPLRLRAKLMDALYLVNADKKTDPISKMRLSYRILTNTSKIKYFEPCIKQYLFSHVKSRFFEISNEEWNMALFMPLERFVGATKQQVWKDSNKIIGN